MHNPPALIEARAALHTLDPADWRARVAAHTRLALLSEQVGDLAAAESAWLRVVEAAEDLSVALALRGLARVRAELGRHAEAIDALSQAYWLLRWQLGREHPDVLDCEAALHDHGGCG